MYTHPGTKLLFMGAEFGQTSEWNHDAGLDWHLTEYPLHHGIQTLLKDLNKLYKAEPALYHFTFAESGFEWVDYSDRENSIIVFMRKSQVQQEALIVVCNFTPEVRTSYRIGVPFRGTYKEIFNSDATIYNGSGITNLNLLISSPVKYHNKDYSVTMTLPPLGISVVKLNEELAEFEIE
jgi:1,4-alpha-glucan branching enzyme